MAKKLTVLDKAIASLEAQITALHASINGQIIGMEAARDALVELKRATSKKKAVAAILAKAEDRDV